MTKLSKAKVKIYVMLLFTAALLLALFLIDGFANEELPEIYELKRANTDQGFLTFGEVGELDYQYACTYKEIDAFIEANDMPVSGTKTVLTDSNYHEMYNLSMMAGAFFSQEDMKQRRQYAVISETLALKLYLRSNPIGEMITIDGYSYSILGVYEDKETLWGGLNKDAYDRVYIPAASYPQYEKLDADSVSFMNNERLFENIDSLLATYPQYIGNYIHINYIEKKDFSMQGVSFLLFVLQITLLIFILKTMYKTAKLIIDKMRGYKDSHYLSSILRIHKNDLIFLGLFVLFGAALIILLARNLNFPLMIPVSAIPDDNLFDVNHYISKTLQAFVARNTTEFKGNNYHYLLSEKTFWAELILLTYIFSLFIILYRKIKKLHTIEYASFVEALAYTVLILILIILPIYFAFHSVSKVIAYIVLSLIGILGLLFINCNIDKYGSVIEAFTKAVSRLKSKGADKD